MTENQREAVTHMDGPLLVVAGAGSGKTRVITRRVAYLAACGVPPYRIAAITFTNKAADEMKRRVEQLTGTSGARISTFHSLCARMLRQFEDLLGFSHPFTIYDRADSLACIKRAMQELGLSDRSANPSSFLTAISRAKNDGLLPPEMEAQARGDRERRAARVYAAYERICRANNALDFDDLLLHTARLLEEIFERIGKPAGATSSSTNTRTRTVHNTSSPSSSPPATATFARRATPTNPSTLGAARTFATSLTSRRTTPTRAP